MVDAADDGLVRSLGLGLSQRGVRDHNERLVLSLLQRNGAQPASDLARLSQLSPPTVSVILRRLEADHLLLRGEPQRGKVGKPSVPVRLDPDGAFAFGLKIGRRSAEVLLLDMTGKVRQQTQITYEYPMPEAIFTFLKRSLRDLSACLRPDLLERICGIGVGAPFEMWNWNDLQGEHAKGFQSWREIDFIKRIGAFSQLPVVVINDATAACQAEHVYGHGKHFRDYAYFYVGAFVGGGVVLNNSVFEGRQHNAGALGALRTVLPDGSSGQLVDTASIHLLEKRLISKGLDVSLLWQIPQDWGAVHDHVMPWLDQTARELAKAVMSSCAVIDFEAVIIDGAFPSDIRRLLVEKVVEYAACEDTRGLVVPQIIEGGVGSNARAIGAASTPIFSQFFLNTNVSVPLLK